MEGIRKPTPQHPCIKTARNPVTTYGILPRPPPLTHEHPRVKRRQTRETKQQTAIQMMTQTRPQHTPNRRLETIPKTRTPIPVPHPPGRLKGIVPAVQDLRPEHIVPRNQTPHATNPTPERKQLPVFLANPGTHDTTPHQVQETRPPQEFVSARQVPDRRPPPELLQPGIHIHRHVVRPQKHPRMKIPRQLVTHARQPQTRMTTRVPIPVHSRELEPRVLQVRKTQRTHEPNHLVHERQTIHHAPTPTKHSSSEDTKTRLPRKTQTQQRTTQHPDTPKPTPPNLCNTPLNKRP